MIFEIKWLLTFAGIVDPSEQVTSKLNGICKSAPEGSTIAFWKVQKLRFKISFKIFHVNFRAIFGMRIQNRDIVPNWPNWIFTLKWARIFGVKTQVTKTVNSMHGSMKHFERRIFVSKVTFSSLARKKNLHNPRDL